MKFKAFLLLILFTSFGCSKLPKGFVYVQDIMPSIQSELRYYSNNNFIGKPIDGYHRETIIISEPAAKALAKVQGELLKNGLSLKVYDAYRPQQAVDHFVRWAKVLNDTLMKSQYYPDVAKKDLFKKGFIAAKSGHTRGSTVDLTIIDQKTGRELDMGSPYDFFGKESHPFYDGISDVQKKNRLYLRKLMLNNGFKPYENEWWHFTLKNEPFPETYFNFPIE